MFQKHISLAVCLLAVLTCSASADFTNELATVAALGDLTNAPTMRADDTTSATTNVSPGEMNAIYYDVLDYTGSATRAYAWLGIPAGASAGSPVPGVVLVHGGGGTAFSDWVTEWTNRGYAAISIAVEGQTDWKNDPPSINTGWHQHAMAGPARAGIYNDTGVEPITDQWMYHAVADTVLANSLLRSLPEVDAAKVGLMGVSWGGVITSTAIGIDDRFAFAVPTYGCGHKFSPTNNYGNSLGNNDLYKQVWDPMVRITNATMPVLWYSWPGEWHFPLDCQAYTYHGAPGARMVSTVPGMGHGHGSAWNRPESYDFADSVLATGSPWCEQQSVSLVGGVASAVFTATKPLVDAARLYGVNTEVGTIDLGWVETGVTSLVEGPAGTWTVTAAVPGNATAWLINVKATGSDTNNLYGYVDPDLVASSDYQEIIDVSLTPPGGTMFTHPVADTHSTGTVGVAFSAPTNIEIVDVQVGSQSHPGAFTDANALPLVFEASPDAVEIAFDNSVAGLAEGETATGMVTVTWEHLDGSTDQTQLPIRATVAAAPAPPTGKQTITIDDSGLYRSQDRNADEMGDAGGAVSAHPLVGFFDTDNVGNMHMAWSFQMTGVASVGQLIDADFTVSQVARQGGGGPYDFGIEAHIIRTSSTDNLGNSDYEASASLLTTNFNGGAVSGLKSLDAAGKSVLHTYLQDNWVEGEYIVIGLKTDPLTVATNPASGHDYYRYAAEAQLSLTVDHDITEHRFDYASIQRVHDKEGDGVGDSAHGAPANNLVGYWMSHGNIGNMHMVWGFHMTGDVFRARIADADFRVDQTGVGGATYDYEIDVHVVRTDASSAIGASDYEASAGLIMTNFAGSTTGTRQLDAAGRSALTTYLQGNWVKGDYIFIGLKTDPLTLDSYPQGANDTYHFAADAELYLAMLPPHGSFVVVR